MLSCSLSDIAQMVQFVLELKIKPKVSLSINLRSVRLICFCTLSCRLTPSSYTSDWTRAGHMAAGAELLEGGGAGHYPDPAPVLLLADLLRAERELCRPIGRKGLVSEVMTMLGIRPIVPLITCPSAISALCQTEVLSLLYTVKKEHFIYASSPKTEPQLNKNHF